MAVLEVLKMGDPRLLSPSRPVTDFSSPELVQLIADMRDTMHALDGAGLAAPQIGVGLQVVIFEVTARVVQHEVDHLLGILYPMRIRDLRNFGFTETLFPGQNLQDD
jgi:peptide deformylase